MANQNFQKYRAPPRAVHRWRRPIQDTVSTTHQEMEVYVCTDKETLVRTIIDYNWIGPITDNGAYWAAELIIERAGQGLNEEIELGAAAGFVPSNESLWYNQHEVAINSTTSSPPSRVKADLKSMRKLTPGDKILFRYVGNYVSDSGRLIGVITLFFKEKVILPFWLMSDIGSGGPVATGRGRFSLFLVILSVSSVTLGRTRNLFIHVLEVVPHARTDPIY